MPSSRQLYKGKWRAHRLQKIVSVGTLGVRMKNHSLSQGRPVASTWRSGMKERGDAWQTCTVYTPRRAQQARHS